MLDCRLITGSSRRTDPLPLNADASSLPARTGPAALDSPMLSKLSPRRTLIRDGSRGFGTGGLPDGDTPLMHSPMRATHVSRGSPESADVPVCVWTGWERTRVRGARRVSGYESWRPVLVGVHDVWSWRQALVCAQGDCEVGQTWAQSVQLRASESLILDVAGHNTPNRFATTTSLLQRRAAQQGSRIIKALVSQDSRVCLPVVGSAVVESALWATPASFG